MIVRVARISNDGATCNVSTSASISAGVALTDRKVREGLVDGQDVARGIIRGLFQGLQVIVRNDVIARVHALSNEI